MVNNGASGACHACKHKRKKCDETRPSCLRCARAHRHCPGYELGKERKFVIYTREAELSVLHQQPTSLFHQVPNASPLDPLDWQCVEQSARLEFFNDYCIISSNRDLSRGYLHGLQTLISDAKPSSEVEQACTIIALVNLGRKVGNAAYINRAKGLYSSLLRSFRLSISNEKVFTTIESLMTAALLGLYELIASTVDNPKSFVVHARGVSAIVVSKYSPFDLICGGKLFQLANPLPLEDLEVKETETTPLPRIPQPFSVLCTPVLKQSSCNSVIDTMHTITEPLIKRGEFLLASKDTTLDQLFDLRLEAENLRDAYNTWTTTIPEEWAPRFVGFIASKGDGETPGAGYWPGTIASYYDPYIASIQNSYRKIALLAMNIIIGCNRQIDSLTNCPDNNDQEQDYVDGLTQGIVSSIPYLLSADLQQFIKNSPAEAPLVPGRPVGGLLSMHGLFLLSTLPIVDTRLRVYLKDCLVWIGSRMGIGQATVLSKYTTMFDFEFSGEARVIIWTGMLI